MVKLHWVYSCLASRQLPCCGVLRSNRLCSPIHHHKRYLYPGIPLQSILKYLFIDRIVLSYFVHHSFRALHQSLSDRYIIRGPLKSGLHCTLVVHSLNMLKAIILAFLYSLAGLIIRFFVFSIFYFPFLFYSYVFMHLYTTWVSLPAQQDGTVTTLRDICYLLFLNFEWMLWPLNAAYHRFTELTSLPIKKVSLFFNYHPSRHPSQDPQELSIINSLTAKI